MILVQCTNDTRPEGFLLVAQNSSTYELLGFADTGTPFDYDANHDLFLDSGRYLSRSSVMPDTELELRTEYFTKHASEQTAQLKKNREAGKVQPITVNLYGVDREFDLDSASQVNIKSTIEDFDAVVAYAVSAGLPNDGTVPWVLADNSVSPVNKADLLEVRQAGVLRGLVLHLEYNQAKAYLESLIPKQV